MLFPAPELALEAAAAAYNVAKQQIIFRTCTTYLFLRL